MLEAAQRSEMPRFEEHADRLELAASELASALASHLGILAGGASWEGEAFGGLLVAFGTKIKGQACPEVIHDGDPDGEWE